MNTKRRNRCGNETLMGNLMNKNNIIVHLG